MLGLVAGACVGYLVQADREPTPLPPLSQAVLAQAKGEGPEPLSAAQDRQVRTDGDLRKLLLKRPKGTRDGTYKAGDDGRWMSLSEYADGFRLPGNIFKNLIGDEFRRAAVTSWAEGTTYSVAILLVQYRQEETLAAAGWAEQSSSGGWPISGTGDGVAYVYSEPEREAGYLPVYSAVAHAWRGDIAMEVWISSTKPIPKGKILDLAERQAGRL